MATLEPGLEGGAELVVAESHTAPEVGSGAIHVLATPVMINLMEAAALDAVERLLPPGRQSLGTRIDVSHVAATPVGMTVRARAVVTRVEGNRITFRVTAHDALDLIGEGSHERIVVDVDRFDKRVRAKAARIGDGAS
ncbi:MAG: thioesterase family protein [Rhodospirillales bacterium]|nr:MAG: thioesterase family protein [Rhodospirillales bacterium]